MSEKWKKSGREILENGPVIPVMVIKKVEHAVPLARALVAGGIRVLEIVLRTDSAIDAIRSINAEVPEAITGAGTVVNAHDLAAVTDAGAFFAISPGLTPTLLSAANKGTIPLIPGIATVSELMMGIEQGYNTFKFFPAEAAGGIKILKSIAGPFPQIRFCPTGGISAENYRDYIRLPNVLCVGGSWIVPNDLIEGEDWQGITRMAQEAVAGAH
ncbi:MAG: bifunctional 4-hydroxy-2-oxoglutarate aldolase/2-dehydro-3-deoxy-phosphogluconate aldolase [Proteobacteria bacterium]|nr:bifunctional 4-hydroxy-2-oxoglutarate aldolase/2-dehydro-3-deoxy-phosphogluconate aldolase [Pseudomonadota bacterium]MBU1140398.1 bifunctional 4-hydroxy-2-oxoglutarate aldolase/2-dehydro-3-deoxy-phosphogluconate aldolase [Pseudomonadota bacterium]MBU1233880.1 bifunctional 4-hydroxy-2-oxoglutarate aldolase/2-dehydro-3-deoxy-phosphogluconate aldolase [Pseudomonadota bacterium]MBU1418642.1 bifunctional 4-hydroxy-2-oxoglutarate aldolase/2-dehydro-3-deoxy-phosphogluconate aldolase [Pseudomonadota 